MKTVLHVIDTTGPGGAETVFINLADKIRAHGYRSVVLIRGKGWVYEELQRRKLDTRIMDCKGSFNVHFLWQLIRLIQKEKVDIIQSHLLGSNIYAAMAGLITRKPVFATFHGAVDVSNSERYIKSKCFILNAGVTKFITVSQGLREEIRATGLISDKKTTVIYNGIDQSRYHIRKSEQLKKNLALPKDAILVGSLGNVRPAKSYDLLLNTAALSIERDNRLHFVIAGDTSKTHLMEKLENLSQQLNIDNHIHFIGYQEDSANFLGMMNVFLLTSNSEGFSIATIEALATGLPIVATKCGGPEEILVDNKTGLFAVKGDAHGLADQINKVIANENYSKYLVENGAIEVKQKYSLKTMLDSYTNLYSLS